MHFTGQERDSESGNDNFGARYFGSSMGRFLSPDPSGIWLANLADPQQLNLYSYVRNNPINNTDPFGLDCVYLNDSGTGLDDSSNPVDRNSNSSECSTNGGFWVDGTFTSGTVYTNSNNVALHGFDSGTLTFNFYNGMGSSSTPGNFDFSSPNIFSSDPSQPIPQSTLTTMIHSLNKSGQSDALIGCIVQRESSGRAGGQNPTSSARGLMGVESGNMGTNDIVSHDGSFGMTGGQLYSQLVDPAINIAAGSSFVKTKIGYAHGNIQSGLDKYGTGSPYGQEMMQCAGMKP